MQLANKRDIVINRFSYTTMGTVGPSPLLGSLVDLNVRNQKVGGVEALGVGIGLSIAEETEKELGGLLRPARSRDAELFACE